MIQLGVNIDHVATIRQARYRGIEHTRADRPEPDPVRAAHEAELGGADGITVHLREDRRHIVDRDVELLRSLVAVKLNLEMAATDEMVGIACRLGTDTAMLVPEGREEVTTEGGLDVVKQRPRLKEVVQRLRGSGLIVSAFIDADLSQVEAAAGAGFDVCEVHTGPYARAFAEAGGDFRREPLTAALEQVAVAGGAIRAAGMRFNAGHALNYHNVGAVAALVGIEELHIGHAIISRAVFVGLREAVQEMKELMRGAAGQSGE
ncbi:MAG: pyridoxine 5'-phosphate synthase [Phycisphaerales bacterium]|nr:pyridoxine 5'-phosphate synthase [Phycisphaerales bacterium]